jgi:hypothetical protein
MAVRRFVLVNRQKGGARPPEAMMLHDDDELLKRLELYFDDQQADLALFSATLKMTIMRREDILADLEATLLKAQALARRDRDRSLAELPAVKEASDVSISPADVPGRPPRRAAN